MKNENQGQSAMARLLRSVKGQPEKMEQVQDELAGVVRRFVDGLSIPEAMAFTSWLAGFSRDLAGYDKAPQAPRRCPEPSIN